MAKNGRVKSFAACPRCGSKTREVRNEDCYDGIIELAFFCEECGSRHTEYYKYKYTVED